jgi:hypothetical protein
VHIFQKKLVLGFNFFYIKNTHARTHTHILLSSFF